jgi:hypothetical protein
MIRVRLFKEKEKGGEGRSKVWWPKECSNAWWPNEGKGQGSFAQGPMEGKGEGSFSPLPISPPSNFI